MEFEFSYLNCYNRFCYLNCASNRVAVHKWDRTLLRIFYWLCDFHFSYAITYATSMITNAYIRPFSPDLSLHIFVHSLKKKGAQNKLHKRHKAREVNRINKRHIEKHRTKAYGIIRSERKSFCSCQKLLNAKAKTNSHLHDDHPPGVTATKCLIP